MLRAAEIALRFQDILALFLMRQISSHRSSLVNDFAGDDGRDRAAAEIAVVEGRVA